MRYRLDRSVRRLPQDRVVLGGSPTRLFRLTEAGAELVRHVAAGRPVRATRGVEALVSRWLDAGVVHPDPEPGAGPLGELDTTVVVPVRDRPRELAELLRSLRPMRTAVVVVDDGSTVEVDPADLDRALDDRSGPRVERAGSGGDSSVTVLRHDSARGPAAARNAGARASRTALIAFVDSDCTVTPGWFTALLGHFEDPRVAAVAPRIVASGGPGVLAAYEHRRSPLDLGADPARVEPGTRVSYVPSAALVVRREAFEAAGGFDETLRVGEDVDLVWRLVRAGRRVRYEPRSVVHHDVRADLGGWLRQRFDYGSSAAALHRRHPGAVAPVACSRWSAAVLALMAAGHPVVGLGVVGWTVQAMRRSVPDLPAGEVLRLVVGGHVGAARQVGRAVIRVWWPPALLAAACSRRARRWLVLSLAVQVAEALSPGAGAPGPGAPGAVAPGPISAPRIAGLALLDDLAYGAGVWWGCLRDRTFGPLRPKVAAG